MLPKVQKNALNQIRTGDLSLAQTRALGRVSILGERNSQLCYKGSLLVI
jgi:hypothetical protein